ncbi:hypothetical protein BDN71DRAFT_1492778 [Pleurotus eryngii]|uniref:Uncharacterized protein n=1 Tax=Pleurotus eryngii TaxID=5323 RepID=A0A9P6DJ58_PLEER|nr:hypothetical protein BDN71DRAFT_1492778 [Pleurotus eryngii]
MSSIEMQDLSRRHDEKKSVDVSPCIKSVSEDSTINLWAVVASTLTLILSLCLTIFPRLLRFLSETGTEEHARVALSPLESFLALHFGVLLAAIAAALVLNMPSSNPITTRNEGNSHPLLMPLSFACSLSAFLAYNTNNVGSLSTLVCILSATIGGWGIWTMLFAGSSLVSRKTGADKRTSAFLFGNKNAASVQKKSWKKEQR